MYSVQCTLYTVHCTITIGQLTHNLVYSLTSDVQCTLYHVHCTLYTIHCTLYNNYTTTNTQFGLFINRCCTLYTIHCTLYIVQCTIVIVPLTHNLVYSSTSAEQSQRWEIWFLVCLPNMSCNHSLFLPKVEEIFKSMYCCGNSHRYI